MPRAWFANDYGDPDQELVDTIERTLARLPAGDRLLRCRLLTSLAFELDGAESERGYRASAEAVEMARRLGDAEALTIAANARGWHSFRTDGLAERLHLGAELLALPDKSARYLGTDDPQAHYRHALAVAEREDVTLWREAAIKRLAE